MDWKFRRTYKTAGLFAHVISRTVAGNGFGQAISEDESAAVTPSQFFCLNYILLHDSPSIKQIAEGLSISHPAAVRLVERLEQKGMVVKTLSTGDRRTQLVSLTGAGRKVVDCFRAAQFHHFAGVMERMDEEDRDALQRGLNAFLRASLTDQEEIERLCLKCGKEHEATCPLNVIHIERTGVPLNNV